jgi:TPP-dependent 2-oxoacid decarboxylase
VSGYYLADEISGTYRGMMIAIDDAHWVIFQQMTPVKLAMVLKELAANVKLSAFRKHPRGPKKPQPKRKSCKNTPHVSTAKILAQRTK